MGRTVTETAEGFVIGPGSGDVLVVLDEPAEPSEATPGGTRLPV
jgi:hypothetical protein